MNHFNLWQIPSAQAVAAWHNNLQRFAEQTRLGIPVTIASDPRNHFSNNIFSMSATDFSQWCETLGFGARLATLNWCGSLPTLSGGNTWRWGFAWRSTRRSTWPPNRAGRASAALSARMPT